MDRKDIINKVNNGNYTIEHDQDCGCCIIWSLSNGQLTEDVDYDYCWESNVLYVGEEAIAKYTRYEGLEILTNGISRDDIPDDIWDKMRISEMVGRGDSPNNEVHEKKRRDNLIDYLRELVDDGYKLYRDNDRGFANEYTSIIVSPDTDDSDINDDWDECTPDEWASDYLYNGDAATQAYNSLRVI